MQRDASFLPSQEPPLKRRLLRAIQSGLYWSGAASVHVAAARPRGAAVLMYHSIAGPQEEQCVAPGNRLPKHVFEWQMRFLARNRKVLSLDALCEDLAEGRSPAAGSVVLTFDDAYRDNLRVAAPILQALNLPATLFVPTGLVRRGESPWADELYCAFCRRRRNRLASWADGPEDFDLTDRVGARAAYEALSSALIDADLSERRRILQHVQSELEPDEPCPRLTMSWDELRELRSHYPQFRLGVHSTDHIDLTAQEESVIESEITNCIEECEANTSFRPMDFAYPYNRHDSRTRRIVAESSLRTAMIAGDPALVCDSTDPLTIPRMEAPRSSSLLRLWTSGAHPGLSRMLLGRA